LARFDHHPLSSRFHPALALTALLGALPPAVASTPGQPIRASRAAGPITIDGRLDEECWAAAQPHDGFVQLFPEEGRPASEPTEVRVVYDDRALHVGVRCVDSRAAILARPLGRRDSAPSSDSVAAFIDSNRDQRTAHYFELNAAGVQGDALLFGEDESNADWDAVWDGAVTADAAGWTAEFMIPLSVLRFSTRGDQVRGIGIQRVIARTHEQLVSIPLRRSDRGIVARLADLTGLDGLRPVQELSVAPYLAARLQWRPRSDAWPTPRVRDPAADLGVDLRASIGRGLALQAAINPDLGQVAADTIQVGLLDAVVAGGAAPAPPTRRLSWSPWSPLHLAPGDAYPQVAPATRNFLAATVSWSLHSDDRAWFLRCQVTGSQREGGRPVETLADGTVLRRHGACPRLSPARPSSPWG
jgi:hypothetical protein